MKAGISPRDNIVANSSHTTEVDLCCGNLNGRQHVELEIAAFCDQFFDRRDVGVERSLYISVGGIEQLGKQLASRGSRR